MPSSLRPTNMIITVPYYGVYALAMSPKLSGSFSQSLMHPNEKYLASNQGKTLMEARVSHAEHMHYRSEERMKVKKSSLCEKRIDISELMKSQPAHP